MVASLERRDEAGQERIVVSLCEAVSAGKRWSRRGSLVFTSQPQCALHSADIQTKLEDGTDLTRKLQVEYDLQQQLGVPVVRTIREQTESVSGEFGAVP